MRDFLLLSMILGLFLGIFSGLLMLKGDNTLSLAIGSFSIAGASFVALIAMEINYALKETREIIK